MRERKESIKT